MYKTYTADEEEPKCISCDHILSEFDCTAFCGAEHGWHAYCRTEREDDDSKE